MAIIVWESIKCWFPEKRAMQKKFYVTLFSKNVRFHNFRQEKSIESTFFTHKIAFYFSQIFNFVEMDLLWKKKFEVGIFAPKWKKMVFL